MLKNLLQTSGFQWINVMTPTVQDYQDLTKSLNLPEKVILNCLDSDYLPHVESYGATQFVILRLPEPDTPEDADSVQELTTKIALFVRPDKVVSVHRLNLSYIIEVEAKVKALNDFKETNITSFHILSLFFEQVAKAFEDPLNQLEQKMESFEEKIFHSKRSKALLKEGYYIKRKASAYKKVIKFSIDLMMKLSAKPDFPLVIWQESKEKLDRYLFYADDIFENTQGLLSLHLSIASQRTNEASFRTNEIVRVLTVLTIFFLPLNFIAGVFGMNFVHIPLLTSEQGFWVSLLIMGLISLALLMYVLSKGWLTPADASLTKNKND